MLTKDDLIAFENEVAQQFETGEIAAPIHLNGGSEDQLIKIFKDISPDDWCLCTWRSHFHALLKGIPPDELMRQILAGRSMYINSVEHRFYSSSIAGGILPIAVGLGMAIKRKSESRKVWCFVGDMTSETGLFHECAKYAFNFDLPVTFVIEDNLASVQTPTLEVWGRNLVDSDPIEIGRIFIDRNTLYYRYELPWPHSGVKQLAGF